MEEYSIFVEKYFTLWLGILSSMFFVLFEGVFRGHVEFRFIDCTA